MYITITATKRHSRHHETKGKGDVKSMLIRFCNTLANTLSTVALDSINRALKSSTLLRPKTKNKIKTNGKVKQKNRFITSIRKGKNKNGKESLHSQEKH